MSYACLTYHNQIGGLLGDRRKVQINSHLRADLPLALSNLASEQEQPQPGR